MTKRPDFRQPVFVALGLIAFWAASLVTDPASASDARPDPLILCEGHEDVLEIYLNMTELLFNERDTSRVGAFYHEPFTSHNADMGGSDEANMRLEEMRRMWTRSKQNDPGRVLTNNVIICQQDIVVAQVTMAGTRAVPGAEERRPYNFSAIDIYRFEDGKVIERWGNADLVTFLRQTGMPFDLSHRPLGTPPPAHGSAE